MKTVILYYSYEGNTKMIAEKCAQVLNCDIFRIETKKAFKSQGLMKYVWGGKQAMMKELPDLVSFNFDLNAYDTVLLGTPIWSWTIAPAIRSLLEKHLKDKDIYLFYTHEGGDQNITQKAEEIISKHNRFIAIKGFMNVIKEPDINMKECEVWAKELKEKIK